MDRIEKAFESLLIETNGEIHSRIDNISFEIEVLETKAKCYCYSIKSDANNNLRVEDLIDFIDLKIIDYAIPKKKIDEAIEYANKTKSVSKIDALRKQARELFTDLKKTGEGGELLLYILTIEILKLPQLISKMSLKTSGQLHYQGSDGIHAKFDNVDKTLNLYWGESKMYKNVTTAFNKCFESLNGFLLDPIKHNSTQERDLVLITDNINMNVNNPEFEDLIVEYFNKDSEFSNQLVYKGICFIGYSTDAYKGLGESKTIDQIKEEIQNSLEDHYKSISKYIKKHPKLDSKEIHVFLMPFPSVDEFRKYYLKTLRA